MCRGGAPLVAERPRGDFAGPEEMEGVLARLAALDEAHARGWPKSAPPGPASSSPAKAGSSGRSGRNWSRPLPGTNGQPRAGATMPATR
jgi:hypothetical protein